MIREIQTARAEIGSGEYCSRTGAGGTEWAVDERSCLSHVKVFRRPLTEMGRDGSEVDGARGRDSLDWLSDSLLRELSADANSGHTHTNRYIQWSNTTAIARSSQSRRFSK